MSMSVRFWGVRGSIPTPLVSGDVASKIMQFLVYPEHRNLPLDELSVVVNNRIWTHGGNTSCVQIVASDGTETMLDGGTGARPLSTHYMSRLFPEHKERGKAGLKVNSLFSHEHHDHLQGIPFFALLYLSKERGWENEFTFVGGTKWFAEVESCLRGQMDPPHFPISWKEVEELAYKMDYMHVHDGLSFHLGPASGGFAVTCRKLFHPQETYGYRLTDPATGKIVVYSTDHEPFKVDVPAANLLELWMGADVVVTDVQYDDHTYAGKGKGPQRLGWGHSYPEAIAHAALQARVKKVVTFHHDPGSSDEDIEAIALSLRNHIMRLDRNADIEVQAAYEGLELTV